MSSQIDRRWRYSLAPKFLTETKKFVASMLWLPFSYLVLVTVGAIGTMIVNPFLEQPLENSVTIRFAFVQLPLIVFGAGLIAAVVLALRYRRSSSHFFRLFLRSVMWMLSLPGRGWFLGFGWLIVGFIGFFLPALGTIIGLFVAWWVVGLLNSIGTATWVMVIAAVGILGMTIGGSVWANQHGSGYTGGVPVLGIVFAILAFLAFFVWLGLLAVALLVFLLPFTATLLLFYLFNPSFEPEWLKYVLAVAALALFLVPPLSADGWEELTDAAKGIYDRLIAFFGRFRRKQTRRSGFRDGS